MGSIPGQDRHQQVLFPASMENYSDAANPVDVKPMAACRQETPHALQGGCRAWIFLCQTLALVGRARITLAGSHLKAVHRHVGSHYV
jgi:hypothetical protein